MSQSVHSARDRVEAIMRGVENPGILLVPLSLAEALYGFGVKTRNALYDKNILFTGKAPCKVISVGNLTVGGAGKTPFVELLVKKIAGRYPESLRPGILSRGYGGRAKTKLHVVSDGAALGPLPPVSADEPYMLARKLKNIPVVCSPDRLAGAAVLVERFGVNVIILDDGFQNRAINRDLDILLIDALNPFGSGRLIPRGVLREPVKEIRRSDFVVLTGAAGMNEDEREGIKSRVRSLAGKDTPVITAAGRIIGFAGIDGAPVSPPDGRVYCFCAIANPDYFRQTLEDMGLTIAGFKAFKDHHWFTSGDIERISREAAASGAGSIITTEKDAVRLLERETRFDLSLKIAVLEIEITGGEEELDGVLAEIFRKRDFG